MQHIQIDIALLEFVNISPQKRGLVAHCELIELVLTLGPKFKTPGVSLDYIRIWVQKPPHGHGSGQELGAFDGNETTLIAQPPSLGTAVSSIYREGKKLRFLNNI